jgi:uncharacterized protein (TIGR02466 family)
MNLSQIYAIPIWQSTFPDFYDHKEKFIKSVRDFRKENPEGVKRYNINAYQSPMNLTQVEELSSFYEFAVQMGLKAAFDLQFVDCDIYITSAWVNFNDLPSSMHTEHTHQDTFSGVLYLNTSENSGCLTINNPALNPLWQGSLISSKKNKFTADRIRIKPEEGSVILWPSYLPHSVETNEHNEERISIGFNLICIPKVNVDHTK